MKIISAYFEGNSCICEGGVRGRLLHGIRYKYNVKIWQALLSVFLVLFCFSDGFAICYDPNPIALTIGSSRSGSVCIGNFQKYSFPVINGHSYKITVTPSSSNQDPDLYVNSNNTNPSFPPAYDVCSQANGAGTVDSCSFLSNMTGTVYIAVKGYGGGADGYVYYSVLVQDTTQPPDFVAIKTYLTSISNPGLELTNPVVGDQVHLNLDFRVDNASAVGPFYINCYRDSSSHSAQQMTGTWGVNYYYYQSTPIWTVTSGNHSAYCTVDYNNNVVESNESNNSASNSWNVPQQYDLVHGILEIVDANGNAAPGNIGDTVYFRLNYSISGTGTTPAFNIACTLDGSPYWSRTGLTGSGGQSYQVTTSGYSVTSGSHNVSCDLDSSGQIAESNESNNNSATGWTSRLISPTVSVSPSSGPVGTTFSEPGSGFTPNSTATLYFNGPNGPSTDTVNTLSNGSYSHSWTCNACPVGSYSYYAKDDSTGKTSNTAYFTVYVTSSSPTFTPLYRLYKASIKDHFYTISAAERDSAVTFTYEG